MTYLPLLRGRVFDEI